MTYIEIIESVILFTLFSGVPGVVYFLLVRQKLNSIAGTLFFILLISFLADFGSEIYVKYVFPNSYPIGNTWHLINYIFVSILFHQIIPNRKLINGVLLIVFYTAAVVSFFYYSFMEANPVIRVLSNVSFIVLSLLAYFEMLKTPGRALNKNPIFWTLTAIFVFCSVTLLKNLFTQYLVFDLAVSKDLFATITLIYLLANIGKNFALFYSLILIDKGYGDSKIASKAT